MINKPTFVRYTKLGGKDVVSIEHVISDCGDNEASLQIICARIKSVFNAIYHES